MKNSQVISVSVKTKQEQRFEHALNLLLQFAAHCRNSDFERKKKGAETVTLSVYFLTYFNYL
jgi:hypothetical protein